MNRRNDANLGVDANGCLAEQISVGSQPVILHDDDIPEADITLIRGLRCTTAVRTVIDIAPDLRPAELETVLDDCLARGLFTVEEMRARLSAPDMVRRPGAGPIRTLIDGRR